MEPYSGAYTTPLAMSLARITASLLVAFSSLTATSPVDDGPSPSRAMAFKYRRSSGVARYHRASKNPVVKVGGEVEDGQSGIILIDDLSGCRVPGCTAVRLRREGISISYSEQHGKRLVRGGGATPVDGHSRRFRDQ